jgi:hypothetical protein
VLVSIAVHLYRQMIGTRWVSYKYLR